jgi:HSP20 family protein
VGERPQGTFSRQLFLGETLDTDRIDAQYVDGVLTLKLPVAEKAKPRRVPINIATSGHTAINTNAQEKVEASV